MATVTLTARYLDHLNSHGKRYEVFDALVPGLAIRVSASGRKSFTLYYRHQGRMRRVGLGRYPDVAPGKGAAGSRRSIAGASSTGADPAGDKQAEHAQNEHTVQALYELYRTHQEKILRSWSEVRRIMEREVLPVWRHRRVVDLHRRDIRELVEEQGADGADPGATACFNGSPRCSRLPSTRIGSKRIRRGGSRNRDMNAVAIACSRATSYASSGPRCMRRRRRTLTARRSRDSRRR